MVLVLKHLSHISLYAESILSSEDRMVIATTAVNTLTDNIVSKIIFLPNNFANMKTDPIF